MAEGASQASAADAAAPPQPGQAARSGRGRVLRLALVGVGLFVLSAGGSWFFSRPDSQPADTPKEKSIAGKKPKHPALLKKDVIDVKQAESLLREGNHAAALVSFETLAAEAKGRVPAWIQFRIGLCREALGQWDKSAAAFREAGGQAESTSARFAAQLAQARLLLKINRPAQAKPLLLPLLLRAADIDANEHAFLAEVRYLYALSLAQISATGSVGISPGGLRGSRLTFGSTERYLQWPIVNTLNGGKAEIRIEEKPDAAKEEWPVYATTGAMRVADLIERLALLTDRKVEWSLSASQRVAERSTHVAVDGMPWMELVDTVADSVDLVCTMDGVTLRVKPLEDISKDVLANHRRMLAQRALREAAAQFPAHALTPVAYLELGNYEADGPNPAPAAAWYERIVKEFPASPLAVEAHYNLGAIHRRLADRDRARRHFYRVVDQAPSHPASSSAYWQIGMTLLEDGKPKDAVRAFRHAMSLGGHSPYYASIVLTAAGAQILSGDPSAAHDLILRNRGLLREAPFRQMGAFLDGYALYEISVLTNTSRREQAHLLATLLELRGDAGLGPFAHSLIAKAYVRLKMFEQAGHVCETSLAGLEGAWAEEMKSLLADINLNRQRRIEAVKLYQELSANEKSRWSAPAQFKLAQIALAENRPAECLQTCKHLWNRQPPGVERQALLQLMGEAFDRAGEPVNAARCFAGQPPE